MFELRDNKLQCPSLILHTRPPKSRYTCLRLNQTRQVNYTLLSSTDQLSYQLTNGGVLCQPFPSGSIILSLKRRFAIDGGELVWQDKGPCSLLILDVHASESSKSGLAKIITTTSAAFQSSVWQSCTKRTHLRVSQSSLIKLWNEIVEIFGKY